MITGNENFSKELSKTQPKREREREREREMVLV
jgi:hypothetical protein